VYQFGVLAFGLFLLIRTRHFKAVHAIAAAAG
jgi:hypothetical protein